jgi:hypothetical protein
MQLTRDIYNLGVHHNLIEQGYWLHQFDYTEKGESGKLMGHVKRDLYISIVQDAKADTIAISEKGEVIYQSRGLSCFVNFDAE